MLTQFVRGRETTVESETVTAATAKGVAPAHLTTAPLVPKPIPTRLAAITELVREKTDTAASHDVMTEIGETAETVVIVETVATVEIAETAEIETATA
jgi:hypothetical protein